MDLKLELPLRQVFVTQRFGTSYLDFYKKLGLLGHNGLDFRAKDGCDCLAAHSGVVLFAGKDASGGIYVMIWNKKNAKTIYYHLKDVTVKVGQNVNSGQLIGHCDNTGKYTNGDHLHFGLKETNSKGDTINYNNGYKGAIDPSEYFLKNWDRSRAYHRYGRKRTWIAEYWFRFAPITVRNRWSDGGRYVQRRLRDLGYKVPMLSGEQVNAVIYGGWDFETVINVAMDYNWKNLKKSEYLKGVKPFT